MSTRPAYLGLCSVAPLIAIPASTCLILMKGCCSQSIDAITPSSVVSESTSRLNSPQVISMSYLG